MPPKISVIVPVYNEEENISELFGQITQALDDGNYTYEVVFVNDGSTDRTWTVIKELSKDIPTITGIDLAGNFGQSSALAAGIDHAKGELIVTLDGDLQNDPNDIPAMISKMDENDLDLIAGIRANRKDGLFLRKIPSFLANSLIRISTGVKFKDYGCTLKVIKKNLAKDLGLYGELHRFIPVLAHLQGARISQMKVNHRPRIHGKSKYGISRTFRVISDLLLMLFFKKYLQRPMHLFGTIGILIFFIGIIINIYMVILKILGQDIWGKPMLMLGIMLTLGGIQLITIGILAEILMRTYYESQNKKPYKIKNILR
jgi:glycosyltransferase involved in cell wall biosynthesis